MARHLDTKSDLTFKKVFGEHPNFVASLLNSLLLFPHGMMTATTPAAGEINALQNGDKYAK